MRNDFWKDKISSVLLAVDLANSKLFGIGTCQLAQEHGRPHREGLHHFFYGVGDLCRDDGRPGLDLAI